MNRRAASIGKSQVRIAYRFRKDDTERTEFFRIVSAVSDRRKVADVFTLRNVRFSTQERRRRYDVTGRNERVKTIKRGKIRKNSVRTTRELNFSIITRIRRARFARVRNDDARRAYGEPGGGKTRFVSEVVRGNTGAKKRGDALRSNDDLYRTVRVAETRRVRVRQIVAASASRKRQS